MNVIIFIITVLVGVSILLLKTFNYPPAERYKQWYLPIVFLLEALIFSYYFFEFFDPTLIKMAFQNAGLPPNFEIVYVLGCMLIMLATKAILKVANIYNLFARWFPNLLSNSSHYNDTFYYFPYVQNPMGSRPGVAYLAQFFFIAFIAILVLIGLSMLLGVRIDYYIHSGMFAFAVPVLGELYNFYKTDLDFSEPEEDDLPPPLQDKENLIEDDLWLEYVANYGDSFDIAFTTKNDIVKETANVQNQHSIDTILYEFERGKDIIVENLDIPTSFHKLSKLLVDTLTGGGNILFLVDIPEGRHNRKVGGKDMTMMELFTEYLSDYLQKNVPASNEILRFKLLKTKSGEEQFKSRIILSSVATILESDILSIQWFDDLDLLVTINFSDKGRTSFFENQKFNLLIEQKNKSFQTVIISPFRQGLQASLTKVWKLDRTCEKRFTPEITAKNHYCIISNFESWHQNWLKAATPVGINLYSGVELAIPAISLGVERISYLDIEGAEIREGVESLGTSRHHIIKYDLSQRNIDKIIQMNMLPFFMFPNIKKQFSIIYDIENNAPAAYHKWLHLGEDDNFSIVISKPYLFKSYFADNIQLFRYTPMLAIEPVPSLSKINLTILLYNLLKEDKVSERQIKKLLNDYDISLGNQPIPVFLRELFIRYFNFDIEENSRLLVEETVIFSRDGFDKSYLYSLAPFQITHFPQFAPLRTIKIIDNRGILRFEILKDMLFQNYLPGQKHVFNGRTFEITSYDEGEGTVSIRNLPQFNNHLFYASCLRIDFLETLEGIRAEEQSSLRSLGSEFSLTQFESSLNVTTLSYYEFRKKYQAITKSNIQEVFRIDLSEKDQMMAKRNYRNCRVMKLEWKLDAGFSVDVAKIQTGLQLLLFEAVKSFFPYNYQYLVIYSDNSQLSDKERADLLHFPWIFPDNVIRTKADCVEVYLFEDATSDMGILNAIRENYTYIFQYIYDYLCWLEEPARKGKPFAFDNYLNNIKNKYEFMQYGFESLPAFIDPKVLKKFADIHFPLDSITKEELRTARNLDI